MSRGRGRPQIAETLRQRDAAAVAKLQRMETTYRAQLDAKDQRIARLLAHLEMLEAKIAAQQAKLTAFSQGPDLIERQVRDLRHELDKRDRIIAELRSGLAA
jgi:chromosome segregation ATPase